MIHIKIDEKGHFGFMLKSTMEARNVSLRDLSRELGCSVQSVSRWVVGEVRPQEHHIKRMCKFLGMNFQSAMEAVEQDRLDYAKSKSHHILEMDRDIRITEIEPYMKFLSDEKWAELIVMVKHIATAAAHQRKAKAN